MTVSHRAQLEQIRTFPQLIRFLRDEMAWPIESEDFEDLTFTYTLEELGIAADSAANNAEIKRLRPLVTDQPWGIFFVKFEPKRLPVVALRRILSAFVMQKRASANSADRMTWETDDLLFISSYGDDKERQLSFAHFSPSVEGNSLPTLKVLGWDSRDTALHLDAVAETLTQRLAWPANVEDTRHWRESWRAAFTLRHREVITTSREMSIRLAELARAIRNRINTALSIETENGPLTKLMKAFREALVHDLTPDGFADMYAQTIAYGLLSARIADPKSKTTSDLGAHMRTNPLLRDLMTTFLNVGDAHEGTSSGGLDFDELGVNEVIEVLDDANMEAVLRDFGDRNPQEDPVIHFYELFLKEYDAKKRMQRGVFYTPRPVVSYIVRSVDELLRAEFGLNDGLADTSTWGDVIQRHPSLGIPDGASSDQAFVQILDPATGTGTFLVEVIDQIHRTLLGKWQAEGCTEGQIEARWNEYVPKHLLPRLHGYELLMAPYAIAHLKIGLKLHETGYLFGTDVRARVFLTNSLEPASHAGQQALEGMLPALAHEAQAVNEVKHSKRFTVLVGNPPYSNFGQLNRIPFILGLLEEYKRGLDERKINLDDDFIKFVRLSQHLIDATGSGVFGMITNNVFLDGITHRKMRESLLASYSTIRVLDLHGSAKKLETADAANREENVFDIQQGVGISLCSKSPAESTHIVLHADLWGSRAHKSQVLIESACSDTSWEQVACDPPHFFFVPKSFAGIGEYLDFSSLAGGVFDERNAGIQTKRDGFVYHFTETDLTRTLDDARSLADEELRAKYGLPADGRDWAIRWAKADIERGDGQIRQVAYHPFDLRWTYFTGRSKGFMAYPRTPLMWSALQPNLLLLTVRNPRRGNTDSVFVGNELVDKDSVSPFDNATFFPLYVYPVVDEDEATLIVNDGPRVNLNRAFLRRLSSLIGSPSAGRFDSPAELSPEEVFDYVYAVLHSPTYRDRYSEFLKIDYPRLPLPGSPSLFESLARLGNDLIDTHLGQSPLLDQRVRLYEGPDSPHVSRVGWVQEVVWLDAAPARQGQPSPPGTMGFRGVPEAVWNFRIGGYNVCHKWLKDRKGRTLSGEEISRYEEIVSAISETIRLMGEIDEAIEEHGGWPGAFASSEAQG